MGHFLKANVPPKKYLREFPITPENALPVGYIITARHFVPGQYVDIQGVSCGKGKPLLSLTLRVSRHNQKAQLFLTACNPWLLAISSDARQHRAAPGPRTGLQRQEDAGSDGKRKGHP